MPKHQTVKTRPDEWGIKWPPVGSFSWPRSLRHWLDLRVLVTLDALTTSLSEQIPEREALTAAVSQALEGHAERLGGEVGVHARR